MELEKIEKLNPDSIWYSTPTISNEFPQTKSIELSTEFDIQIHEDDYRQKEFLKLTSFPTVEKEIKEIKKIWQTQSKKSDDYTLFKNCHVRDSIGNPNLDIQFDKLCSILQTKNVGQVIINGQILINGFTIQTRYTTYFGVLSNNVVNELCIEIWNKETLNEIDEIIKRFDLLFVNWYNCDLIK